MSEVAATLRTTALYQRHRALGAKMVDFAGWLMPLQYRSILEEHRAVRQEAGLFDVSHMGRVEFTGPDCVPYLQRIFTCDVARLAPGRARYALICLEDGGILDDTILYCRRPDAFLLVCNAANTPAVLGWLQHWKEPAQRVTWEDRTAVTAMLALQGPRAPEHLASLSVPGLVQGLAPFSWGEATIAGIAVFLARTGYTGEDGFEIIAPAEQAPGLWSILLERGVVPCGLGARDTLRLEAALPLHGNDITAFTNPVQAGLLWTVALDKGPFIGRAAIVRAKTEGTKERLVGFELIERGIPRAHCRILAQGREVGHVTSGGYAPSLNKGIGMGYVLTELAHPGVELAIDIRGTLVAARTVKRPFYTRAG